MWVWGADKVWGDRVWKALQVHEVWDCMDSFPRLRSIAELETEDPRSGGAARWAGYVSSIFQWSLHSRKGVDREEVPLLGV